MTSFKFLLPLAVISLLSACSMLQTTTPTPEPVAVTPTPLPPPQDEVLPEVELKRMKNAPTITLQGRTVPDVMADIEKYRLSRGMTVVSKTRNRIEFAAPVARAKRPTQARVRYTLQTVKGGVKVAARAYQISYPGTAKEKVADITSAVSDRLLQEFARYKTAGTWN